MNIFKFFPNFFNSVAGTSRLVRYFNNITWRSNPIEYTHKKAVSGGTVVFYLTVDGTAGGAALFTNGNIDFIKAEISDSNSNYNYDYVLTNSNKTLTVTPKKTILSLAILTVAVAADGVMVNILVKGN